MRNVWTDARRSYGASLTAAALLLVVVTLALYSPSLPQPFTSDDYQYLYGCGKLRASGVLSVFHPAVQGVVLPPFYRPTSVAFFLGLSRLFGLAPLAFHTSLLMLRITALVLALLLFARLFGSPVWGAVAALALAVNPFGIEPGVWPAAVPDSLLVVFLLGALLCFDQLGRVEARGEKPGEVPARLRGPAGAWLAGGMVCGLLALASKEPAVLLPLLVACLPGRARPLGRMGILGLLALDGLYLGMRLWMRAHVPTPPGYDYWHILENPRGWGWWRDVGLAVGQLLTGPVLSPVIGVIGAAIALAAIGLVARSHRGLPRYAVTLAGLLLLLPLAITSGVGSPRYGFLPSIGIVLIMGALARVGWAGRGRWMTGGVLVAWLLFQASLSHFWIREWGLAARASEEVARFLASRPEGEETVLLWVPGYRVNFFLGVEHCLTYSLTDAIYPSWMKGVWGKETRAMPLLVAGGLSDELPKTERSELDVAEVRSGGQILQLAIPSIYTGGVSPNINECVEVRAQDPLRVQLRLKRAPGRAFFTLTDQGWKQL